MANALTSVTTDLTAFGRILLGELRSKLVLAALIPRGNAAGATLIGNKVEYPDLDVDGEAATRAIGAAATASDVISTKRQLTVQQIYKAITVDNLQNLFSSVPLMERAASRIAYKVAKKCDSIVAALWNHMPYECGELDGTAAFNATDGHGVLADAYKILMVNEADTDNLKLVVGPSEANAIRKLTHLFKVNEAGSSASLRNGQLGRLTNFDIYESQQIASNFSSVAAEASSPGAVVGVNAAGSLTLSVDAIGAGTMQSGTSFTIDSGAAAGRYVVTADTAIVANAAVLPIWPALKGATAGAEAITFTVHVTAGSSQNFAFSPEAFSSIFMPPSPFREGSGIASTVVTDDQTGLSVRVACQSALLGGAGVAYSESLSADVTYGAEVVRPEFAVRVTGLI